MAGADRKAKGASDLPVRTLSAFVMIAVAGAALWFGTWIWTLFVTAIALGVMWEWRKLVEGFERSPLGRMAWTMGGMVYIGIGALVLNWARNTHNSMIGVVLLVGIVIAIDVGAYFTGRTLGGPKIAPRISPSKTWSGLVGGIVFATVFVFLLIGGTCADGSVRWRDVTGESFHTCLVRVGSNPSSYLAFFLLGTLATIAAQAGDFFESWMKRRAGVKDSGKLIPGHGGLFDRVDGLLAVCFLVGLAGLALQR